MTSSSNATEFIFEGCNVHVRYGVEQTDSINGAGNLIVGYDEERYSGSDKTGSHNMVIGPFHNYSSYGGLVAGSNNTISNRGASVSGGQANTASGGYASVSGGEGCEVALDYGWGVGDTSLVTTGCVTTNTSPQSNIRSISDGLRVAAFFVLQICFWPESAKLIARWERLFMLLPGHRRLTRERRSSGVLRT